MITIYHNGECSKSKGALEILMDQNIPHEVRYYLAEPLTKDELAELLSKLDMQPSQIVRKNEPLYMESFSNEEYTETEWLDILIKNPILIERPIVTNVDKAIVARPPERVMSIL
jgi:arsenate reductase